ncbi:unnamed protein product [Peniophora sp. CBMAI 1063]|nr:unnamed protein product [Peniophora sp. CBMAI 1063]
MSPTQLPSTTSWRTLKVRFITDDKDVEKLVLSQLDVVLDKPTILPEHVYLTSPVRIHRVSDVMKADLDLVYNAQTKKLNVFPCGAYLGFALYMPRLPISFDHHALRQQYGGGASALPPLAAYIMDAARACAIIKHSNERSGPRDIRSDVTVWMSVVASGPENPEQLPVSPRRDMIPGGTVQEKHRSRGQNIGWGVNPKDGYAVTVMSHAKLHGGLHVALVRIDSATLKPELILNARVEACGEQLLSASDAQGNVQGILRFAYHDELPFNVDLVYVVLSTERIDTISEMLLEEKAWDALYIRVACCPRTGPKKLDPATVLENTKKLYL